MREVEAFWKKEIKTLLVKLIVKQMPLQSLSGEVEIDELRPTDFGILHQRINWHDVSINLLLDPWDGLPLLIF